MKQIYPASITSKSFAAGAGVLDIMARIVGQHLTEKLGQSFFVENRPGGNNNIGTEAAARSGADGYTLFMANSVNTINASLYQKLSYNFIADMPLRVSALRSLGAFGNVFAIESFMDELAAAAGAARNE